MEDEAGSGMSLTRHKVINQPTNQPTTASISHLHHVQVIHDFKQWTAGILGKMRVRPKLHTRPRDGTQEAMSAASKIGDGKEQGWLGGFESRERFENGFT